jgi:hypothetical protein
MTTEHIHTLHDRSGGVALKVHQTLVMALREANLCGHRVSNALNIEVRPRNERGRLSHSVLKRQSS